MQKSTITLQKGLLNLLPQKSAMLDWKLVCNFKMLLCVIMGLSPESEWHIAELHSGCWARESLLSIQLTTSHKLNMAYNDWRHSSILYHQLYDVRGSLFFQYFSTMSQVQYYHSNLVVLNSNSLDAELGSFFNSIKCFNLPMEVGPIYLNPWITQIQQMQVLNNIIQFYLGTLNSRN